MEWQPPLNLMRSCGPVLIGKAEEEDEEGGLGGCRQRLGNSPSSLCVHSQSYRFIKGEWSGVHHADDFRGCLVNDSSYSNDFSELNLSGCP